MPFTAGTPFHAPRPSTHPSFILPIIIENIGRSDSISDMSLVAIKLAQTMYKPPKYAYVVQLLSKKSRGDTRSQRKLKTTSASYGNVVRLIIGFLIGFSAFLCCLCDSAFEQNWPRSTEKERYTKKNQQTQP